MYIQLTEQCNMSCAHCCMNAPKSRMPQMDRATFLDALALAENFGDMLTIGGGEPTLHKEFQAFIEKAIEFKNTSRWLEGDILIVTNGKLKGKTHWLLDQIEEHDAPLTVELSQDEFHDPIDPLVVQRFRRYQRVREGWHRFPGGNYPKIGIRTVNRILPVGRAIETQVATEPTHECCCCTPLVAPNGDVYSCGCKHTKIGNVRYWRDLEWPNSEEMCAAYHARS